MIVTDFIKVRYIIDAWTHHNIWVSIGLELGSTMDEIIKDKDTKYARRHILSYYYATVPDILRNIPALV